ncbi:MAG: hypothetical protein HYZ75_04275 [Elusimicrobia bacterium]|nr:hypothetical protein [Elusimicrobiota bacterium]
MDETLRVALQYPAAEPPALLRRLAEAADKGAERPSLQLLTRQGQSIGGLLLRVEEKGVVLSLDDGGVFFTGLGEVAGVVVRNHLRFAGALSGGTLRTPGETPPTRLELRRELAGSSPAIEPVWEDIPESGDANLNIRDLARALAPAVAASASDPMGREAWSKVKAVKLVHRTGALLSAAAVDGGIVVSVDLSRALPSGLEAAAKAALEQAL